MIMSKFIYQKYFLPMGIRYIKKIDDNYYELEDNLINSDVDVIVKNGVFDRVIIKKLAFYTFYHSIINANNKEIEKINNEIKRHKNNIFFFLSNMLKTRYIVKLQRENLVTDIKILDLILERKY